MKIKMRKNMAEIITENRTGQRTGICIIIGAGELTVDAIPVRPEDFVIAADGGYAHCRQLGVEPDLILEILIPWMRKTDGTWRLSGVSSRTECGFFRS